MKGKSTPVLTGLFVLGALLLAVAGVVAFGGGGFWRETREFVVFFDESVHGLARGSAVKLLGVQMGRVASVQVTYREGEGAVARVVCEIERSRVADAEGREIDLREKENLLRLVEDGLRARLNLAGITGMLFVEMNFFDPADDTRAFALDDPTLPVVPSNRSALFGVTEGMARVVSSFEAIDFPAISEGIITFLDTAERTLDQARVDDLLERMAEAVEAITEVARAEELHGSLRAAREAFEDFGKLARKLEEQVDPVADGVTAAVDDVRATLEEMGKTLAAARETLGTESGTVPQVVETLDSLREAAHSVRRLADYLERHPQALLGGRKPE